MYKYFSYNIFIFKIIKILILKIITRTYIFNMHVWVWCRLGTIVLYSHLSPFIYVGWVQQMDSNKVEY